MQVHAFARPVLAFLLQATAAAAADDGLFVFNYVHHGQDWRQAQCGSRERQSPINFDRNMMGLNSTDMKLFYQYEMVTGDVPFQNDGHSLSADFAGQGYGGITYEQGWYNLININFHAKSEHTFDGKHYAMELHLVHKRYDGPHIIVVAIPIDCAGKPDIDLVPLPPYAGPTPDPLTGEDMTRMVADFANPAMLQQAVQRVAGSGAKAALRGRSLRSPWYPADEKPYVAPDPNEPNSNHFLQKFVTQLPPKLMRKTVVEGSEIDPINLNLLLKDKTYFEYVGSFTVPPCSEDITWMVAREPIMAGDTQVRILYETIYEMTHDFGNYRSAMPLAGRVVAVRTGDHSLPIAVSTQNLKGAPPSTRQFQGETWASDAIKEARKNVEAAKELSDRIHAAGQAHADQIDPRDGPGPPYNGSILVPTFHAPPGFHEPPCESALCHLSRMGDEIKDKINDTSVRLVHEAAKNMAGEMHEATVEAVHDVLMMYTPPPPPTVWPKPIEPTRSPPIAGKKWKDFRWGAPPAAAAAEVPPAPSPSPPAPPPSPS